MKPGCLWFVLAGVGLGLSVVTLLFDLLLLPSIIRKQVGNTLALTEGSAAWERFINTPLPLDFKVYIMEVTNPDQVVQGGRPHISQTGPFIYRENLNKIIMKIDEKKHTVSYKQKAFYSFSPNADGTLSDMQNVTVLNPLFAGLAVLSEHLPEAFSLPLQELLDYIMVDTFPDLPKGPFITMPAGKLLFGDFIFRCNVSVSFPQGLICSIIKSLLPVKMIRLLPDGNYALSLLGFRNATGDMMEVKDGKDNPEDLGRLISWNGKSRGTQWRGDPCNILTGNDMTLLSPFISKTTSLNVFNSQLCSAVRLVYEKDTEYQGIPGFRFVPSPEFMGDVTRFPRNACFCPTSFKNLSTPLGCLGRGVLDITGCLEVPVILSKPHFLDADSKYLEPFDGLSPNSALHNMFIDLQPLVGIPMKGNVRIQANIMTRRSRTIKAFNNFPDAIFPLLWFEEGVSLGPKEVAMIQDQAINMLQILNIVKWVLITSGILMAVVGTAMGVIRMFNFHF